MKYDPEAVVHYWAEEIYIRTTNLVKILGKSTGTPDDFYRIRKLASDIYVAAEEAEAAAKDLTTCSLAETVPGHPGA